MHQQYALCISILRIVIGAESVQCLGMQGDWSRASTVKPVGCEVGATVWGQVSRCDKRCQSLTQRSAALEACQCTSFCRLDTGCGSKCLRSPLSPLQIVAACREDPAQLKSTVAMLHAAFEQVNIQLTLLRAACLDCQLLC